MFVHNCNTQTVHPCNVYYTRSLLLNIECLSTISVWKVIWCNIKRIPQINKYFLIILFDIVKTTKFYYVSQALSSFARVKNSTFARKMKHLPGDFLTHLHCTFARVKKGTFARKAKIFFKDLKKNATKK